jgi:hypothetical protein
MPPRHSAAGAFSGQRIRGPRAGHEVRSISFPQRPVVRARYRGGAGLSPIGWVLGRINMTNWQADLDALVQETMALRKALVLNHLCRAPSWNRTGCRQ